MFFSFDKYNMFRLFISLKVEMLVVQVEKTKTYLNKRNINNYSFLSKHPLFVPNL